MERNEYYAINSEKTNFMKHCGADFLIHGLFVDDMMRVTPHAALPSRSDLRISGARSPTQGQGPVASARLLPAAPARQPPRVPRMPRAVVGFGAGGRPPHPSGRASRVELHGMVAERVVRLPLRTR
jgi:hypothetical protein